jgi:hypothetical protein
MSEYRIYGLTSDGCVIRWSDVQCDSDRTALLMAINALKPGDQAEVWSGEALIGAASLPVKQPPAPARARAAR